jgi:hypothetical protein
VLLVALIFLTWEKRSSASSPQPTPMRFIVAELALLVLKPMRQRLPGKG